MKRKFFIISGPQAAGKSSAIKYIADKYRGTLPMLTRTQKGQDIPASDMVSLEESRAMIVHKYQRKGAIFMSDLDELEVIHNDMVRMFKVLRLADMGGIYIDECNIFTLGHAKAHGIDLLDGYYKQYHDMLERLNTKVIFLDVPPAVSWERRVERYKQRHWDLPPKEKKVVLRQHREYLDMLYPELLRIYDMLDLTKTKVDTTVPLDDAMVKVEESFKGFL